MASGARRRLNNSRAEKQPFDVVSLIEVDGQLHDFLRREPGASDVARNPIHAILTIEDAIVGRQNLQQRHTAAVRRVAVANPHPLGASESAASEGTFRAAAGT